MGKIIKYEWRKQRTSRMIILFTLLAGLIAMVAFNFDAIGNNSMLVGTTILLLMATSFLVIFYTGIESLVIFNKDLRTKQSHMLWMVPKSTYEILGGKFIAAILQMLFVFTVTLFGGCVCILFMFFVNDGGISITDLMQILKNFGKAVFRLNIDWSSVISLLIFVFLGWTVIIMVGFLAIIISRTLFLNSKFSGLLSIFLFFVILNIAEQCYELVNRAFGSSSFQFQFTDLVFYTIASATLFLISGALADKKLSV